MKTAPFGRRAAAFTLLSAVAACASPPPPPAAAPVIPSGGCEARFTLQNRSTTSVVEFYFRPVGSSDWGIDRFGSRQLTRGLTMSFRVVGEGRHDLRIVWATGQVLVTDLKVDPINHLDQKLRLSLERLRAEARAGRRLLVVWPAANTPDVPRDVRSVLDSAGATTLQIEGLQPLWSALELPAEAGVAESVRRQQRRQRVTDGDCRRQLRGRADCQIDEEWPGIHAGPAAPAPEKQRRCGHAGRQPDEGDVRANRWNPQTEPAGRDVCQGQQESAHARRGGVKPEHCEPLSL